MRGAAALAAALAAIVLVATPPPGLGAATPDFEWSPVAPVTGETVVFTSSSASQAQEWDLDGDGTFGDALGPTAQTSFATPGQHAVGLRASGEKGSTVRTLQIGNRPPRVGFDWAPPAPATGQAVTFTSTATDADGTVVEQVWDLDGDGSYDDAAGPTASVAFATAGAHTVRLRARDDAGAQGSTAHTLDVANRPPVAAFAVAPAAPLAGDPVTLTSTSTDPDDGVASVAWDLDDDGSFDDAAGPVASTTFARAGSYAVRLRVIDAAGAVDTAAATVTVGARPPPAPAGAGGGPAGEPATRLLTPFPVVRLLGRLTPRGVAVRRLEVRAPVGARITVTCAGRSCPFRRLSARVGRSGRVRVRALERRLAGGAVLAVSVTAADRVGKYVRFTIRRGRPPARADACLVGSSRRPARCPSA